MIKRAIANNFSIISHRWLSIVPVQSGSSMRAQETNVDSKALQYTVASNLMVPLIFTI